MRAHLVAYFEAHHKLVQADALELLLETAHPLAISRQLLKDAGADSPFVTREMVELAVARISLSRAGAVAILRPTDPLPPPPPPVSAPFEMILEGFNDAPAGQAPLEAFEGLFRSRFQALSKLLRGRPDLPNVRRIVELQDHEGTASVLAMVREVRETPEKHHLILRVEDDSGSLEVLVLRDSPPASLTFLPDEVVGLRLAFGREKGRIPRVTFVQRPEVPASRPSRRSRSTSRVLFLSDLHIGSRSFMEDAWGELVDFLHGRGPSPELAHQIHHVVVAGDLVDGIGIYPNQERDLAIPDIFAQYAELGRRLKELPERLQIIVLPGNHDAVCPAEPQPGLPAEIRRELPANVRSVGNPSTFALEGVVVEAYHGRSFDDLIPALPGASYSRPTDVMKRMLSMRHLGPIYGERTPLAPLPRDGMVIDPVPDILVTGHAHTFGIDQYRGTLLINASTWQSETEYQRMRNITAVPAKAAVVSLEDLSVTTLDFLPPKPLVGSVAA